MIMKITLLLFFLVAVNFLLLIFSCNKTTKKAQSKRKIVRDFREPKVVTKQLEQTQLAPTGS